MMSLLRPQEQATIPPCPAWDKLRAYDIATAEGATYPQGYESYIERIRRDHDGWYSGVACARHGCRDCAAGVCFAHECAG